MPNEFWQTVKESRWGNHLKAWWKGNYDLIPAWNEVKALREKFIIHGLMFQPWHFVFNGASFKNELNTRWEDGWGLLEVIRYAPLLRREILPFEIVIEPDIENNEDRLIKRGRWIKTALETLCITYTMGFSGRRSFHFHIIVDPKTELPDDLPAGFNGNVFKQAVLNIIGNIAGYESIDFGSSGANSRHMIREFFSINEKTLLFKVPVEEVDIIRKEFPCSLKEFDSWSGYQIWKPEEDQLQLIFEEIERINHEKEKNKSFFENFWRNKPRRKRTVGSRWRLERIKRYAEVLRVHHKLMADPEISQRHENEHMARLHFLLLMIDEGFTDEEIHEIFKLAEDYKPEKTQYFIDYNRKRVKGGISV